MPTGFSWNGIDAITKGIITEKLPSRDSAMPRVNKVSVPGRDGFLTIDEKCFEPIVKTVEFHCDGKVSLDNIKEWLTGNGEIIFENEPDRYYKASILNQISFTDIIPKVQKGIIIFDCQPFGYLITGKTTVTISATNSTIVNPGNYYSEPYIKLYGSGNVALTVNGTTTVINNVSSYVEIDTELDQFYKGTTSMEGNVVGNCPTFQVGSNTIAWTGTVTKLEIIPRWRCR